MQNHLKTLLFYPLNFKIVEFLKSTISCNLCQNQVKSDGDKKINLFFQFLIFFSNHSKNAVKFKFMVG